MLKKTAFVTQQVLCRSILMPYEVERSSFSMSIVYFSGKRQLQT